MKAAVFEGENLTAIDSKKITFSADSVDSAAVSAAVREIITTSDSTVQIQALACRVVHGGEKFSKPVVVTAGVLKMLAELSDLAPLHNPLAVEVLKTCLEILPQVKTLAVFDTAFFKSLPEVAFRYPLPRKLWQPFNIRRYGFHGIAHQSVSKKLRERLSLGAKGKRLITCHLGGGASVSAVLDGQCVDTSMGFTPMEGLMMASRCGDIDSGIIFYLLEKTRLTPKELESALEKDSGLLGISEIGSDFKEIEIAARAANLQASLAIECFTYRAAKYISSYLAVLGGLDGLAFSGGIGENSALVREKICEKLVFLGIEVCRERNALGLESATGCITTDSSKVPVYVFRAEEECQIAREVGSLL